MPKRDGFPEPLFEDIRDLIGDRTETAVLTQLILDDELHIGRLRAADPFLGDLTVMAREATGRVLARIYELHTEGNPDAFLADRQVQGAVPEDQA